MKLILLISLAFSLIAKADPSHDYQHLPAGGRKGLHGMIIFGSGPYFMEHIPMLTPPHDFQIITEVSLKSKSGEAVNQDFSNTGFTLKPLTNFSLNDFIAGRLKKFNAMIYQGSFETNGKVVQGLEEVSVEIKTYKIARQLPSASKEKSIQLTDGRNSFESNLIRSEQNIQKIQNLSSGKVLWCVKAPDFFAACE